MTVKTSLTIGTHIEHLGEFESIFVIHAEGTGHKDEHASIERTFLHILALDFVLNALEAEGFNLVLDLINAFVDTSVVAHSAVLSIETQEVVSVFHQSSIVSL